MRVILASPEAKVWSERKHIPLGLGYLAAVLREGGHDVMIYDAAVEDVGVDHYLDLAEAQGKPYGLIGVTATTPLIEEAWEMAALAKKRGLFTALGGPHLTIMPLESLRPPHDAYVDYVFKGRVRIQLPGPGQHNWMRAASPICCPASTSATATGMSPARKKPMIPDLDAALPGARPVQDRPVHQPAAADRQAGPACAASPSSPAAAAYKCTFCSKPVTGDTWHARSVEAQSVQEWKWLVKGLGATEIGVTDIWNLKLPP